MDRKSSISGLLLQARRTEGKQPGVQTTKGGLSSLVCRRRCAVDALVRAGKGSAYGLLNSDETTERPRDKKSIPNEFSHHEQTLQLARSRSLRSFSFSSTTLFCLSLHTPSDDKTMVYVVGSRYCLC
jgi:hypothetical protein